jgi:D-tyrosyl-tRNA(Tyr) deacylase
LRIFEDDSGKMNRSLLDVGGSLLVVSQFTLYGDCRKGRRPSFIDAAGPEKAKAFYEDFIEMVRSMGIQTAEGIFQAMMDVELTNQGPVTLVVESRRD